MKYGAYWLINFQLDLFTVYNIFRFDNMFRLHKMSHEF